MHNGIIFIFMFAIIQPSLWQINITFEHVNNSE